MVFRRKQQHPVATVTPSNVVEINDLRLPHTQKQYLWKDYKSAKYVIARPKNAQSSFESGSAEPIAIPISATADSMIDFTKSYIEFKVELIDAAGAVLAPADVDAVSQLAVLDNTKLLSDKVGIAKSGTTCNYAYFNNSASSVVECV